MTTLEEDFADFIATPWDDRAPLFQRMRTEARVFRTAEGVYHFSRYEDVDIVAREVLAKLSRHSEGRQINYVARAVPGPAQLLMSRVIGFGTPEDNVRLRRLVSKAFSPRSVMAMRDQIDEIAARLTSQLVAQGGGDLVSQVTLPFPIEVIAGMLGMGPQHYEGLRAIGDAIVKMNQIHSSEEVIDEADAEAVRFRNMILELVEERRANPGDDLLSLLIAAEEAGDRLTLDELVSTCFVLTGAGHETTANLVGSLTYHLLKDGRRLWDEVREDPGLIPQVVEEGLRFESPLQGANIWWPVTDMQVAGTDIAAGEKVTLWFAAANRDPEVFDNPDTFDIHRTKNPHLGFATGAHFCLGANLARMEAAAALRELITQAPDLQLVSETPSWAPLARHRGLTTLPVTCS
jgi:cytochrome P450